MKKKKEIIDTLYRPSLVNNEDGMILVMALMIMVILALMGTFATQISIVEQQTSTNNEIFQTVFSLGEGVGVEAVGRLESESYNALITHTPVNIQPLNENWLDKNATLFSGGTGTDLSVLGSWAFPPPGETANTSTTAMSQSLNQGGLQPPGFNNATDRIRFAVQDTGVAGGYDESANPQIRAYYLYGLYDVKRGAAYPGQTLIEMGYRYPLQQPQVM